MLYYENHARSLGMNYKKSKIHHFTSIFMATAFAGPIALSFSVPHIAA
jgi:hypothetical protein